MNAVPPDPALTGKPRRRIAIFLNDLILAGGIQRVAVNLARHLAPQYDVTLITVYGTDRPVFSEPWLKVVSLYHGVTHPVFFPRYRQMLPMGRRLRRVVAEGGFETVICIWWHLAIIAAYALPSSVRRIGFEHMAFSAAEGRWPLLRRWAYARLDAVVSLSQADASEFARISKHALVIPNFVDLPQAPDPAQRENIILAVGHIEYRKGFDRLIWALKEPLRRHRDWKLVIVGGGEVGQIEHWYIPYMSALAELLGIAGQVELHPGTQRIGEWYARASIYVMGSRLEGFPMVLLEAKSYGLPVVAYDCPTGPREIVRHETDGFLIPNDLDRFAAAIETLIADPSLRARMGEAAVQDVAERFSPRTIMGQWRALIEADGAPADA